MADLGAEVIKIERPGVGDDGRGWGPPFVTDATGTDMRESAYYLSANRDKHSVAINIADRRGQGLVQALAAQSEILVDSFKKGSGPLRARLPGPAAGKSAPDLMFDHRL